LASPVVLIAILYTELISSEGESESQCGNKKWSANTGVTLQGSVKVKNFIIALHPTTN